MVIPSDDEHHHGPEYACIKKSKDGLPQQEVTLNEDCYNSLVCGMDTALSTQCILPPPDNSPNYCSTLLGKNGLHM